MEAIIQTGGKQVRISPGDVIQVEKIEANAGESITLNQILYTKDDDNQILIGKPWVENAVVKATVLNHGRGKKIIVFKLKKRKGYRRKTGHRQDFTRLKIDEIVLQ